MKKSYVFRLLERYVSHELEPNELYPLILTPEQIEVYREQIAEEKQKIEVKSSEAVFRATVYQHEAALVRKYHEILILLINQTYQNIHNPVAVTTNSLVLHEYLLETLSDILQFFRIKFRPLLGSEERLPITELLVLRAEIEANLGPLDKKLKSTGNGSSVRTVLLNFWNQIIEKINLDEPITVKEAVYVRMIMKDTAEKYESGVSTSNCPSLHELLVYWNLNTIDTIRYFSQGLETLLNDYPEAKERLEFARLQLKNIMQMPEITDSVYDEKFPGIKAHFAKYLQNEINYLESKSVGFAPLTSTKDSPIKRDPFKVLLNLSVDQISLILRGAERKEIVDAISWSAFTEQIAPYISTKNMKDISPQSIRGKAYSPELTNIYISLNAVDGIRAYLQDLLPR